MTNDIYQRITNDVIAALENGTAPWHKPWFGKSWAVKHKSGEPYSLLNQMLLGQAGEWLSFSQIQAEKGRIKKGAKSRYVVFWKWFDRYGEDEDGNKVVVGQYPMLKYYNVWHISDTEGIKEKYPVKAPHEENDHIASANKIRFDYVNREKERAMDGKGSMLRISALSWYTQALYRPSADCIELPSIELFDNSEEYYSTLFHEMVHSTGHEKRLNREGIVKQHCFGDERYSKEELIAEMGAAFLCNAAGLDPEKTFDNSAAYINGWLKELRRDHKLIVQAASQAQKAAEYILTGKISREESKAECE